MKVRAWFEFICATNLCTEEELLNQHQQHFLPAMLSKSATKAHYFSLGDFWWEMTLKCLCVPVCVTQLEVYNVMRPHTQENTWILRSSYEFCEFSQEKFMVIRKFSWKLWIIAEFHEFFTFGKFYLRKVSINLNRWWLSLCERELLTLPRNTSSSECANFVPFHELFGCYYQHFEDNGWFSFDFIGGIWMVFDCAEIDFDA